MKKYIASALLLPFLMAAQNHDKACGVFSKINQVLQTTHIEPKPIDDSLSVYVFETVMENLDDNRTLFLQEEYNLLAKHKYSIDDYLKNKDCSFFSDFITTYKNALTRSRDIITQLGNEELPFTTSDTIYYSRTSFPYQKTEVNIKKYLQKRIVYETLEDVSKLSKDKDSLRSVLAAVGKTSKKKITESLLCRIDTALEPSEGFDNSIYNNFFSVFCSYFDPHSTYFNYNEHASFVSHISTENYSLGLYVSQNDKEEIIVEEIVPGGPAYKTNRIDKGDRILKLAANNAEYTVSCASMQTINDIVSSDSFKTVELTLRKNDGTVYSVSLEKKIMKADDHSVYSFIVGDENPMGYIKIPSFYTAFDNNSVKGCADDVAKEIIKLKNDNIKGLIIDLQYNGGGSMDEVIKMAGMFIDFGPLSFIVGKDKSQNTIKDYNRGTLYNGPMVILVNGFSASASEFFAGVLQDYNRALIVGNTTLGKATMQTILPLEDAAAEQDFIKVTIDRFYRVTGKSSQYTGVEPDVRIPSFFDKFLPRESSMPTALKNDSITVKMKFKELLNHSYDEVKALSQKRIKENAVFKNIESVNAEIEKIYLKDKAPLPLTFDSVFDDVHAMDDIWKEINTTSEEENSLTIINTSYSNDVLMYDEFLKSANEEKIKALKTDPYVYESINILTDLYKLNHN